MNQLLSRYLADLLADAFIRMFPTSDGSLVLSYDPATQLWVATWWDDTKMRTMARNNLGALFESLAREKYIKEGSR